MVWHKLVGLFLTYNLRAQYWPIHSALTHNIRHIGNTIFHCLLAVSRSALEKFITADRVLVPTFS